MHFRLISTLLTQISFPENAIKAINQANFDFFLEKKNNKLEKEFWSEYEGGLKAIILNVLMVLYLIELAFFFPFFF